MYSADRPLARSLGLTLARDRDQVAHLFMQWNNKALRSPGLFLY
jgi:hypothetical protein